MFVRPVRDGLCKVKTRRESSFNMHTMHAKHTHACVHISHPAHTQDYRNAAISNHSETEILDITTPAECMNLRPMILNAEDIETSPKV